MRDKTLLSEQQDLRARMRLFEYINYLVRFVGYAVPWLVDRAHEGDKSGRQFVYSICIGLSLPSDVLFHYALSRKDFKLKTRRQCCMHVMEPVPGGDRQ